MGQYLSMFIFRVDFCHLQFDSFLAVICVVIAGSTEDRNAEFDLLNKRVLAQLVKTAATRTHLFDTSPSLAFYSLNVFASQHL